MSRLRKLSHTLWHCQYHVVWVPKYRCRVMGNPVKEAVDRGVRAVCGYSGCEVVELMGRVKGQFPELRRNKYWGNHCWTQGDCVDRIGVNAEMIRKYVKYQEKRERTVEQMQLVL